MRRGSFSSRGPGRSAVARASAALARGNQHLALALWLIVFMPGSAALALHHYVPAAWRRWADVVFVCAVALAFTVAWAGEQAKRAR
jgi:hypothetical protein